MKKSINKRSYVTSVLVFIVLSLTPAKAQDQLDQQYLTLPLSDTIVTAHFDLDEDFREVEDATGYTCGNCQYTPGDHAYDGHDGVDFRAGIGTDVLASIEGVVTTVVDEYDDNWHPEEGALSFGNYIVIFSEEFNIEIYYAHLQGGNNIEVEVDDQVERGQIIATADNTGSSNGSHLHFEVRDGGNVVDPFSENLWATNNAEMVTNTDHILSATEYLNNQEEEEETFLGGVWNWFGSWFSGDDEELDGQGGGPTTRGNAEDKEKNIVSDNTQTKILSELSYQQGPEALPADSNKNELIPAALVYEVGKTNLEDIDILDLQYSRHLYRGVIENYSTLRKNQDENWNPVVKIAHADGQYLYAFLEDQFSLNKEGESVAMHEFLMFDLKNNKEVFKKQFSCKSGNKVSIKFLDISPQRRYVAFDVNMKNKCDELSSLPDIRSFIFVFDNAQYAFSSIATGRPNGYYRADLAFKDENTILFPVTISSSGGYEIHIEEVDLLSKNSTTSTIIPDLAMPQKNKIFFNNFLSEASGTKIYFLAEQIDANSKLYTPPRLPLLIQYDVTSKNAQRILSGRSETLSILPFAVDEQKGEYIFHRFETSSPTLGDYSAMRFELVRGSFTSDKEQILQEDLLLENMGFFMTNSSENIWHLGLTSNHFPSLTDASSGAVINNSQDFLRYESNIHDTYKDVTIEFGQLLKSPALADLHFSEFRIVNSCTANEDSHGKSYLQFEVSQHGIEMLSSLAFKAVKLPDTVTLPLDDYYYLRGKSSDMWWTTEGQAFLEVLTDVTSNNQLTACLFLGKQAAVRNPLRLLLTFETDEEKKRLPERAILLEF